MKESLTDTILMIRPVKFRFNEETAVNNYYQQVIDGLDAGSVQQRARQEFDNFVDELRSKGVRVIVVEDTPDPETPDSIFPNNWISFHSDGKIGLYPMYAENRRKERRSDILDVLKNEYGMHISDKVDFTGYENESRFLEGTGSMVLDRGHRIAYAAISERTDKELLGNFCDKFGYKAVSFVANQTVNGERLPIYHTNVMMCVGDTFAVLCADSIDNQHERSQVIDSLEQSGKEIIYITEEQVRHFAGNMLEVCSAEDPSRKFLVMSGAAFKSLNAGQIEKLKTHAELVYSSLDTIEALGGGSARCMMAEVFLPASESIKN